ncbi:MAG TPA: cytochrome P450 [Candidatus Limnocylindrales bacterium]|jgi:cytochrome P450|nr:cytochrome P450 [Candidatus Limnocylindrales bacterium]
MAVLDPEALDSRALFAPHVVADPFPLYRELRPRTPFRTADGHWVVMKHRDVFAALSSHRVFSSNLSHIDNEVLRETPIIFEDPPGHTRHRKLVQPAFTQPRIEAMAPWVEAVVQDVIGALAPGEVEAISALCDPLPVRVIAQVMGVPPERHLDFKRWSDERTYLVAQRGRATSPKHAARIEEARDANRRLLDYFVAEARSRRAQPLDDLITDLVVANDGDDALTESEVAAVCALLLTAGNVTTTNVLGNLLAQLADHPEVYIRLRDDRSLIDEVIEESLRFEAPVQWLYRRTLSETELGGVKIPADASVLVYFGAANRDPDAYPEPDRFDLVNRARRHAAFGHGIHFCLGAPLARLEVALAVDAVLDRFSGVERGSTPARRIDDAATHCGHVELPLILRD